VIAEELVLETVVLVKIFPVLPLSVAIRAEADLPTLVLITVGLDESKRIGPETVSVTV